MASNNTGASIDGPDDAAAEQSKLTDLLDECLEDIFMHLHCDDLINIADTHKHLKTAADTVFARKFGKKKFRLHVNATEPNFPSAVSEDFVNIYKLKTMLQLLRCFGHFITKLQIVKVLPHRNPQNYVLQYMVEYCSNTLIELSLNHIDQFDSMKSLPKVEIVEIECNLTTKINFNKWFPVMRRLDLKLNNLGGFFNCVIIEKHFPQLEEFGFMCQYKVKLKPIQRFLRKNPQLRSFKMSWAYSPTFYRYASKLPQLNHLQLCGYPYQFSFFSGNEIHFKTVNKLELFFSTDDGWHRRVFDMKFLFERLEEITLHLDRNDWGDLTNFFQRHPTIVKVTLLSNNVHAIDEDILTGMVQVLPMLSELHIFTKTFPVNDLLRMITRFNLVTYGFDIDDPQDFIDLKVRLGIEWQAIIDGNHVSIQRIA